MILVGEYETQISATKKLVEAYYTTTTSADDVLTLPLNSEIQENFIYYDMIPLKKEVDYTFDVETGQLILQNTLILSQGKVLAFKYKSDYSIDLASFNSLKDYCLRELGAPLLKINVSDEQINDRMSEAIYRFLQLHGDGSEHVFLVIPWTDEVKKQGFAKLPQDIIAVRRCLRTPASGTIPLLSAQYMFISDVIWSLTSTGNSLSGFQGLQYYYISRDYLQSINNIMYPEQEYHFNQYTHKLVPVENTQFQATNDGDAFIVCECFRALNLNDVPDAYNDIWLKKYCTQLIKRQWGTNLMKFNNIEMVGGITIDGRAIYDEANQKITELEEELNNGWSIPPLPQVA